MDVRRERHGRMSGPRPKRSLESTSIRIERIPEAATSDRYPSGALEECHRVRREVFVDEQHVPLDLEMDELDEEAIHFIARSVPPTAADPTASASPNTRTRPDAPACGTARMRVLGDHAKAERVAVIQSARKLGVGQALMVAIEELASRLGLAEVHLNAQTTAIPFYERIGYRAEGPEFDDAGIPHRFMRKPLA